METDKNNNFQSEILEKRNDSTERSSSLEANSFGEILIVDDNQDILNSIGGLLESTGFDVNCASSAVEALCLLEKIKPDLILSDVQMDGIDGFEFQRIVRQNDELLKVPFVFLTALSDPVEIRKGKSSGCDDYLVKPFHTDDLIAVIEGKLFTARNRESFNQKEINQYCKDLIERLSHEFRTPLVAINTGAELLQMKLKAKGDDGLVKISKSIARGGNRLQKLVEDFLTIQSIQSGQALELFEEHKKTERMSDLLDRSVNHLLDFILPEDINVDLNIDSAFDSDQYQVQIVELQFRDVLRRLIDNSLKFAGIENPVEISLASDSQTISIMIRDHGPGMKAKECQLAQDLFGQISRGEKEQQGCGLGITISTWLTEINQGELIFHIPDSGSGLLLELRFPRYVP